MDETKSLKKAVVQGAAFQNMTLPPGVFTRDQLAAMFGDGSVTLPEGVARPAHWPDADLGGRFHDEWRLWQSDPDGYLPPERRAE